MINKITIDGRTIDSTLVFERTDGDDLVYQTAVLDYFRDEEKIPLSKLAKYYLNENLNFLCGSGTSVAIGGKTINKDENPFEEILTELNAIKEPKELYRTTHKVF
ncbi:MAG: hypothetical protein ACTHYC_14190 [Sphingobacterium sp.]